MFSPRDRDEALNALLKRAEADVRLEAAVITGSLGDGRADRWSDIDLDLVVATGEDCERIAAEWVDRLYRDFPVVHHYATAFGTTLVRGLFLPNSLLLDLAFTPGSDFKAWGSVRVAFDRKGTATTAARSPVSWTPTPDWKGETGFAWHDILHACAAADRGRHWQALYFLQRIRNRTLSLASERRGFDATEFKRVDDLPAPERDPMRGSIIPALERDALIAGIHAATVAFLSEVRRGDPALADRLEGPVLEIVEAVRAQAPRSGRADRGSR